MAGAVESWSDAGTSSPPAPQNSITPHFSIGFQVAQLPEQEIDAECPMRHRPPRDMNSKSRSEYLDLKAQTNDMEENI